MLFLHECENVVARWSPKGGPSSILDGKNLQEK